jgi:hypothetical protein
MHGFLKSQIEISYEKITEKIAETQEMLRKLNQMENESVGNTIIYGEAEIIKDEVRVNGESFSWDNLLIATGARPFIPDIKGSQYGLTNKDILKIDDVPEKLNIIGANTEDIGGSAYGQLLIERPENETVTTIIKSYLSRHNISFEEHFVYETSNNEEKAV